MTFDSPTLGGYRLENPPKPMNVFFEAVVRNNELADGGFRQRVIGHRLRASLQWTNGWIRDQDLTGLATVANDTSATLTFIPRSDSKPSLTYSVIWINKHDFVAHRGDFGTYQGTIELVAPQTTSIVGDLP